jgi:uncharacterized membrane protein
MARTQKFSSSTNVFAIFIGVLLLIEGIWGLFSNVVFGILTTNMTHAVTHIILGITAITLGLKQVAGGFCILLGIVLLVIGILRFVPGTDTLLINMLNLNKPLACQDILVGLLALLLTYKKAGAETVKL